MLQVNDNALKELIPKQFVIANKVIPLSVNNGVLTVAMVNPNDLQLINAVESLSSLYVEAVKASEEDIHRAIEGYADYEAKKEPEKDVISGSVIDMVNSLIIKAIDNRATDIHIEPEKDRIRTRYRIDGILQPGITFPREMHSAIITRIKIMANLNISESRVPQDGGASFSNNGREVDIRVSTFLTIHGEKIAMRVMDKEKLKLGLEYLGLLPENCVTLRELIKRPSKIILVTGPTGSGKTTTLYSALMELNSLEKNIVTLEDPVEYELPLINQTEINPKAGLTFAIGLRSILRQDPDIIFVGEIRDSDTLEVAIRAALTGHLVFSTLHTNNAAGAIPRLLNMEAEPYLIASSLSAILSQRLVRVICENCKEPARPQPEILHLFGLDEDEHVFYRGRGCEVCNNSGYKGRAGIFEILVNTEEISDLIMKEAESETIEREACKAGMKTMMEDGIEKAKQGITTLEEIVRVISV